MQIVITIAIIAINVFSLILNWKMLNGFESSKKIKNLIIGEVIMLIITTIIYQIGSIGMTSNIINASRMFIVSTFLAINSIIILSPILKLISKVIFKEIDKETFKKKLTIYIIITIIIIIFECFYINSIQNSILKMSK